MRTLRQLPPGKPNREQLIGFGDPYFNKDQESEAEQETAASQVADAGGNVTRGLPLKRRNSPKLDGVDSAELGLLPRLPDTAEELKSIALAMQSDPSKVLYLGKNASEGRVKAMNLSGFKGSGLRHARTRTGRAQWSHTARAGAVLAERHWRECGWPPDHGGDPRTQA